MSTPDDEGKRGAFCDRLNCQCGLSVNPMTPNRTDELLRGLDAELDFLLKAIRANDPKRELDLRVRDLRAAIASHLQSQAGSAPGEGWVLVPRKPSEEMIAAWDGADAGNERWLFNGESYAKMLTAAPSPPVSQPAAKEKGR